MDRNAVARAAFQQGARAALASKPGLIIPGHAERVPGPDEQPLTIGIVVPSGDQVHANFAMALAFMMHVSRGARLPLINVKGSNVARQRNDGVAQAQGLGCPWILMVDSDMTFPPNALARLLAHQKDIVGGTYARRCLPHDNLAKPKGGESQVVNGGLVEVDALPTGFLLIRTEVFEKLKRPYFRWGVLEEGEERADGLKGPYLPGEDYNFCEAARAAGFSIWLDVDLSYELVHWGEHGIRLSAGQSANDPAVHGYELVELQGGA